MTRISQLRDQRQRAGDWLRSALEQAGLTTGTLGEAMGVHQTTASNYTTGQNAVPEERIEDLARALNMGVIEVRRGLGRWVPADYEQRAIKPEEAIRLDDSLDPDQRWLAVHMLAVIRRRPAPTLTPTLDDEYDPDAPPWRPGVDTRAT